MTFKVENGIVVEASGGELAKEIEGVFELAKSGLRGSKRDVVWTVAEFGIGMNPKALEIVGNKLEDQVVRGSAYFGFGDNTHLGGSARVGFHLRGVIRDPNVTLEETTLISEGNVAIR